jgi:hypothetical protein
MVDELRGHVPSLVIVRVDTSARSAAPTTPTEPRVG